MKYKNGFLILEILLVMGLLAIILPALLTGLYTARSGKAQQDQRVQALSVLKEAQEAVKNVRNQDWNNFAVNGTFHPVVSTGNWTLASGSATLGDFTQSVVISDTNRDTSGNIVSSGGTVDPSTKKIVITVSWSIPYSSSISSSLYVTRHSNIGYTETTQTVTQFNAPSAIQTNVKVQASAVLPTPTPNDGEIVLSQTGGFGDWCNPALSISALDLPKNGIANAIAALSSGGQAASGTGDNASGVSYANVTVSNPVYPTPPVAAVAGTFDGYKTNGVFTEQNYAYLATDTGHQQGAIIDLTSITGGKYDNNIAFGTLDIGSSSVQGRSLYVLNNIAYLTASDNKLYTFDLTNRSGNHLPIGSVSLAGLGNKVVVVGTKAYVAVNSTSNQLQIIDVTNPRSLPTPVNLTVNGLGATDLYVNIPQNRAYLITALSSGSTGKPEFFLINLGNNTVLGSYDTYNTVAGRDMSPKGVIAVSGAKVVVVGTGGQEYQVLRVDGNNETAPLWCGGLDVNTGINGISTVFTSTTNRAFSYLITGDSTSEFKMIEGGPGGSGSGDYVPTGTFVSQAAPFGPTALDTTFNGFVANIYQPVVNAGTGFYGVLLQVAVADPVNGSCANAAYNFIGTDATGTGTTHYFKTTSTGSTSISGVIPVNTFSTYRNPSKCFKYKAILNTNDSTLTPVFKDITINYSP